MNRTKQTDASGKNSPAYLQKQINGARQSLLMILIFTLINLVMLVLDSGRYFLFSASVPYYLTAFCMGMDYGMGGSYFGTFTVVALIVSAVVLAVYLVCWLLSKKKPGWLILALVLFVLDTLVLVLVSLGFDMLADNILDFIFHAWVIVEMIQAAVSNKKLKALNAQNLQNPAEFGQPPVYNGPEF